MQERIAETLQQGVIEKLQPDTVLQALQQGYCVNMAPCY